LEQDAPRPDRTPSIDATIVNTATRKIKLERLADAVDDANNGRRSGIREARVCRIWKADGLKPHRVETLKISKDAPFVQKLETITGLHLKVPGHARVLCGDGKEPDTDTAPDRAGSAAQTRPCGNDDPRPQERRVCTTRLTHCTSQPGAGAHSVDLSATKPGVKSAPTG